MSDSLISERDDTFICGCHEWMRSACIGEPFYKEHESKHYCVLHHPTLAKRDDFQLILKRKLLSRDFDFRGVWFPDKASFRNTVFGSKADFHGAHFSDDVTFIGATFKAEADFNNTTFVGEAYFQSTIFDSPSHFGSAAFRGGAHFRSARFKGFANFNSVTFQGPGEFNHVVFDEPVIFDGAAFNESAEFQYTVFQGPANLSDVMFASRAHFRCTKFNGRTNFISTTFGKKVDFGSSSFVSVVDFFSATFLDHVTFAGTELEKLFGDGSTLDLQYARIETPAQILFHTVSLRPHWFINVNPQEFAFANVDWLDFSLTQEIQAVKAKGVSAAPRMLEIAYRHLALNAEENHRYEEASNFRYQSLEVRRLGRFHGFAFWRISWWYWLASGYGERIARAFLVILAILFLTALLYNHVGFARWEPKAANESDVGMLKRDEVGTTLSLPHALAYSAGVMTLQKPEPRPATPAAQAIVLLETILGPVQAALLALAIRRKFMR